MLIIIIIINLIASIIYSFEIRKKGNVEWIPKLVLCIIIPVFGLTMFLLIDYLGKRNFIKNNELGYDDENDINFDEELVADLESIEYVNTIPIHDALEIKDIYNKRKTVFKSVKGDFRKIYPFLLKIIKDPDPEVVHYGSAAITDFRQKINENYKVAREKYIKAKKESTLGQDIERNDISILLQDYLKNYIDLIYWEDINDADTLEKRKEIVELFISFFNLEKKPEEYFYIQKIKNDIVLKNFTEAYRFCMKFTNDYPDSEYPYLSTLELYFYSKKENLFYKTLSYIDYKDIYLTLESEKLLKFWKDKLIC